MSLPSISVVITTRDRADLAQRALRSAVDQSQTPVEVVVIDDGSVSPFTPAETSVPVQLLRNDVPLGPSASRNKALSRVRGEWVTFLDDDDVLDPRMIEVSLRAAVTSTLPQPVSVLSGAALVAVDGTVVKTRLPPTLGKGQHFFLEDVPGSFQTHATLVAPTEVIREIDGFDESLRGSEHDDFFLRLNAVSSIQGIHEVLYSITVHEGQRLSKAVLERAEGMKRTVEKHRKTFAQHPKRFSVYCATMGMTFLRAGCWGESLRAMSMAVRLDPLRMRNWAWLLASLAGPYALSMFRRIRNRLNRRRGS